MAEELAEVLRSRLLTTPQAAFEHILQNTDESAWRQTKSITVVGNMITTSSGYGNMYTVYIYLHMYVKM